MFGRDMTGLSREELAAAYEQKFGEVMMDAGWDYLARISSSQATKLLRPLAQELGNLDVAVKTDPGRIAGLSGQQAVTDASGNTLPGQNVPLVELELRKHLDPKLSVLGRLGVNKDLGTQETGLGGSLGLEYGVNQNLKLDLSVGRRDDNQSEGRVGAQWSIPLPNMMGPKKGDVDPPRFERFDVYPTGPGKYQLYWQTDEVTKCLIEVLDPEGAKVRSIEQKGQPDYRHELALEGLDREKEYLIRVTARDLNGNPMPKEQKASPWAE
jgi:hypothetical protein